MLPFHAASLGALAGAGYHLYGRAMRKIEAGASADEPVLESDEAARWTGPTVSGGAESLVPWSVLGREGRRHALTFVRPQTFKDRPDGVPDLSIETVMGEPARATPAHVYVSLDSAPTARERADLALAEMERVGAFDRSLIMLVSPTGTGYVNYVAVAAAAYLTRGDVATVTMQYSKRPSPLSLGKVKDAREQNRHLWLRIVERLHHRPGQLPRVVVFGESLGAHTSQDAFLHWGTLGPQALGIERALWIGTPYLSGWMHEVTAGRPARRGRGQRRRRQRLRPARGARRGAPRAACASSWSATTTTGSPSSGRTSDDRTPLARDRTTAAGGGRRGQPARHPAGHAVAPDDDVLPEPDRHEERADTRGVPMRGRTTTGRTSPGSSARSTTCRPAPSRWRRSSGPSSSGSPTASSCSRPASSPAAEPASGGLTFHIRLAATTARPLVAQCRSTGATRLPLRRRSSANTTPARAVNTTVPRTVRSTRRRPPGRPASLIAVLVPVTSRAGRTCQRPKSADVTRRSPPRCRGPPRAAPTARSGTRPPRRRRSRAGSSPGSSARPRASGSGSGCRGTPGGSAEGRMPTT